jgi:Arc/MetJ-type ribon-helix-helix transcriptional regulator
MTTINISLPDQLKKEAENLIGAGYYSSFSDLVRDGLRRVLAVNRYDSWYEEAKKEEKTGKAVVMRSKKDVVDYFKKF